jgi:dTDP-glucose 4,6-dehydratase
VNVRLLVTGAAGFIGSNFTRYWSTRHPADHVVALDSLTYAGNVSSLPPGIPFAQLDIGDLAGVTALLAKERIDVIVNFAAESHNSLAVLDPRRFFQTNVMGTQHLLEAARQAGVSRFHHVSTCEVYGDLDLESTEAFTEQTPYQPRTPYNASKAGADHLVRAYHHTFGLPITITNCANNYGPYQFPEKVIPLFITRALTGQPLPVYASSANRREWLHVDDHCSAIEQVLLRGVIGETYNVGSGHEASVIDLATAILRELDLPDSLITTVPDRPGHDRRYLLDSSHLRETLGWKPTIGFTEGLSATVSWYQENGEWWKPLLDRSPVNESSWVRT